MQCFIVSILQEKKYEIHIHKIIKECFYFLGSLIEIYQNV